MSARAWFLSFLATATLVAACGARSELGVPAGEAVDDAGPDADMLDAGPEADAPFDAPPDVVDAPPDAPFDAPPDAPFDAPPPTCVDAGITFIYVVTEQNTLYSYYPPENSFTFLGTIDCPAAPGETPYSMAVDRGGTAYVVFTDGTLFRVGTADASCAATGYVPDQQGFHTFGMGFSADMNDPDETLFVTEASFGALSKGLASIDTTSLALSFIGPYSQPLGRMELTGTGDGRLFGFSLDDPGPGGHLSELDKATAKVLSSVPVPVGDVNSAFAYAFWGGAFYVFTSATAGATTVTRYDPTDQSAVQVNTHPETIVGAGVSTCAPH